MENSTPAKHSEFIKSPSIYNLLIEAERSPYMSELKVSDFVRSCAKVCALYGIAIPDALIMQELLEFTSQRFHWLTIKHFELAFKLNASHELNKKVEHFGAFSITFIGDIMNLYRPLRDNMYLQENKLPEQTLLIADQSKQITKEQILLDDIKLVKEGKSQFALIKGAFMLEWLETEGKIDVNSFTEHEYSLAKKNGLKSVYNERGLSKFKVSKMNEGARQLLKEAIVRERLRELYVIYLKKQS
jgi:hypothetical protein